MNNFRKLKDENLSQVIQLATTILASQPARFGVDADQVELLQTVSATFDEWQDAARELENQRRAAVKSKQASREQALNILSSLSGMIYANPNITNAMLSEIGFAPRARTGIRTRPRTPQELIAQPFADGQVALKWKRNGNSRATLFEIQFKPEGEGWRTVASCLATKIKLNGFAPGKAGLFRIRASVNGRNSGWSNGAAIYVGRISREVARAA